MTFFESKIELSHDDKELLQWVQDELVGVGGPEKAAALPKDLREFLIEIAGEWREAQTSRKRVTAAAITQDINYTLKGVEQEVGTIVCIQWSVLHIDIELS